MSIKEVRSKKIDSLAKKMFDLILLRKDPFREIVVITPKNEVSAYLKAYYLKHYDDVLMNVSFFNQTRGFYNLFDTKHNLAKPSQIRDLIIDYLNNNEVDDFREYFKEDNLKLKGIKLFDVAERLEKLLSDYDDDLYSDYKSLDGLCRYLKKKLEDNNLLTLRMLYESCDIKESSDVYLFGFINETNLIKEIINKIDERIDIYSFKLDKVDNVIIKNEQITRAPTPLKEIEALHATICKKLLEKNTTISDFLVVSSNLSNYTQAISRVFNQDDENFPKIPYTISSSEAKDNEVYNGLKVIKDIYNKGYYSRFDFCELINNKVVKHVRGISDTDTSIWTNAIIEMNVFNNCYNDDFDYAKKRILLSKISDIDDVTSLSDTDYIPYSIIGLSDDSICQFISLVDDLDELLKLLVSNDYTNQEFLTNIKESFDKLFSIKDDNLLEISYFYKNVSSLIDYWVSNELYNVPLNAFIYSILDEARLVRMSAGTSSGGVRFVNISDNFTLSSKYLFMIGLSSNNYPSLREKNPFDNRDISYNTSGSEDVFKWYLSNSSEAYLSYVYVNLKNDEEYFLSPFVKKYCVDLDIDKTNLIPIDEDRKWKELFTKKEYKDKLFSKDVLLLRKKNRVDKIDLESDARTSFTTNQIAKFLEEPLNYKAEVLFGGSDDKLGEIDNEFEDIKVDALDQYNIFKDIIVALMEGEDVSDIYDKYLLTHTLPLVSDTIAKANFDKIYDLAKATIDNFRTYDLELLKLDDYKVGDVTITNNNYVIKTESDNEIIYIPLKELDKIKNKDMLYLYVTSLIDVARKNNKESFFIKLVITKTKTKDYTLNSKEANELLSLIVKEMSDFNNNYFFDFSLFSDNETDLYSIIDDTKKPFPKYWGNSKYKDLFDLEKDLGYTFNDFKKQFNNIKKRRIKLVSKVID